MSIQDPNIAVPRFIGKVLVICLYLYVSPWHAGTSCAQEHAVPVNVQIPLFLKILTYDNNLGREDPGTVTVGIVYTEGDEESEDLKVALEENLREYSDKTLKGHPMRFLSLPFNSVSSLRESVRTHGIKVLYVAVSDISEIRSITDVSRSMDALTISGNPAHVSQGVSVVLGIKEKKPEIIVNLPSSRKEGTDFSAHLLRVCRVMQQD